MNFIFRLLFGHLFCNIFCLNVKLFFIESYNLYEFFLFKHFTDYDEHFNFNIIYCIYFLCCEAYFVVVFKLRSLQLITFNTHLKVESFCNSPFSNYVHLCKSLKAFVVRIIMLDRVAWRTGAQRQLLLHHKGIKWVFMNGSGWSAVLKEIL